MTKKIQVVPKAAGRQSLEDGGRDLEVGQWFWTKFQNREGEEEEFLSCIVKVGSNYAEVDPVVGRETERIHFDHWDERCRPEPDPDPVIAQGIESSQRRTNQLMEQVRDITARLALTSAPGLGTGSEGQALARMDSSVSAEEHKAALVRAKKETLPKLFDEIKDSNKTTSLWMKAKLIPLRAEAESLKGTIDLIEGRIFNVDLYAGLSEQVKVVREGEPAGVAEKVHLMQRRCYMDEECLAQYEVGGMEFKDIGDFDEWIAREANLSRLLPHPRCVTAFRVRRDRKERAATSLQGFISMLMNDESKADETTFLYIRNGERLYRMRTAIDFGEKLFPDMDVSLKGTERMWAKTFVGLTKDPMITEGEYLQMKKEWEKREKKRKEDLRAAKRAKDESGIMANRWEERAPHKEYVPFDQTNVLYDDILRKRHKEIEHHNRIVLVLQGLLDRSEVLHPHPGWKIWTPEGFQAALELEYDESRALVGGERPDFEAYRARLNASIRAGTVTVGQQKAWRRHEGEKERKRLQADYRTRDRTYLPEEHEPYGNPGPGQFARIAAATKTGKLTYKWWRRRVSDWREREPRILTTITIHSSAVLNVDAYQPGDFRQFFNDPRTRAEYLKWAPLLLEAEEYKAGNRKVRRTSSALGEEDEQD